MPRIVVNEGRCRGCALCAEMCPKGVIDAETHLNRDGYHPARMADSATCTGCAICALMCPHVAIERVYR